MVRRGSPIFRARSAGLISIAATVIAAAPALADKPREPLAFKAKLGMFWGGLMIYSGDIDGRIDSDRYVLKYRAGTRGPLRLFLKMETRNQATGVVTGSSLKPVIYRGDVVWRSKRWRVDLNFEPGGTIETKAKPTFKSRNRRPVPAALSKGALDPLTTLMSALTLPATKRPCDWNQRIYDGRVLFELSFENKGPEVLGNDGLTMFRGKAVRCIVRYRKIAGAAVITRTARKKTKQLGKKPPAPTIWVAQFARTGTWLPVRAKGESKWGTIRAGLTSLTVEKVRKR